MSKRGPIPHFTSQYPILHSFWSLFCPQNAVNSSGINKRDKMIKNEKNGSPPNGVMGSLLTCTPHFASKNTILQPVFAVFLTTLLLSASSGSHFQPQGCSGRGCQHLTHPPVCSLHICGRFDTKFTLIRHLEVF